MIGVGTALLASISARSSLPATPQVLSPTGDQIWQQQHVYSETHFNVGARGPGSYKVW